MFYFRNLTTKEEKAFKDAKAVAEYFDISESTVYSRIKRYKGRDLEEVIWPGFWQCKLNDNKEWKDILPDFSDFREVKDFPDYLVNQEGKVWSNIGNKIGTTNIGFLEPVNGVSVALLKDGKFYTKRIHQIVKEVFPDDLSGFREIPGFPSHLIDSNGRLYSKHYKRICKPFVNHLGYAIASVKDGNGTPCSRSVHHLVMAAFKYEDYLKIDKCSKVHGRDRYVVNHIDGNKLNNCIDNLEVITNTENIRHARDNDLLTFATKVVMKHKDGRIVRFNNTREASRFLGLNEGGVLDRLDRPNPELYRFADGWQCKVDDGSDVFPDPVYFPLVHGNIGKAIMVIDHKVSSLHEILYETVEDFIKEKGGNYKTIRNYLKEKHHPILPNLCQIKDMTDISEWRLVMDPLLDLEINNRKGKPIVFFKEGEKPLVWLPESDPDLETLVGLDKNKLRKKLDVLYNKIKYNEKANKEINKWIELNGYRVCNYINYRTTEHYKQFKDQYVYLQDKK